MNPISLWEIPRNVCLIFIGEEPEPIKYNYSWTLFQTGVDIRIGSRLTLLNQRTTDKTETLFAPAEQYVYRNIMCRPYPLQRSGM